MSNRDEFEAWAESAGHFVDRDEHGMYRDEETGGAWYGWQEATRRAEAEREGWIDAGTWDGLDLARALEVHSDNLPSGPLRVMVRQGGSDGHQGRV